MEQSDLLREIVKDIRGSSLPTDSEIDTLDISQKQLLYEQQKQIINRFKAKATDTLTSLQNELDNYKEIKSHTDMPTQRRVTRQPVVGSAKYTQIGEIDQRCSNIQKDIDHIRKMITQLRSKSEKGPIRFGRKVEI